MNRFNYQDRQVQAVLGTIATLVTQLQKLAPHPDMPDYKGPLFINNNPMFKKASEHDGMLGMMMMEAFVGGAFADAIGEAFGEKMQEAVNSVDMAQVLECYSEYISDVEGKAQKIAAHGQGTMARMSGTSISKGFNLRSTISEDMQAFLSDLPKRMEIERGLAFAVTKLNNLAKAAPVYAAPAPRIAA